MLGFQVWATTTGLIILFNAMLTSHHQENPVGWQCYLVGPGHKETVYALTTPCASGNCPQKPSTAWWQAGYILLAGISWMDVDLVPNTIQHVAQVGSSLRVSKHTICKGQVSNWGACLRRAVKLMNGRHISKALADLGSYWQAHCSQYVSQLITSNFIFLSVLFDKLAVISLFCNSGRCPSPVDTWKGFLPFSASSYPGRNEALRQKTTRKKMWMGRAQSSTRTWFDLLGCKAHCVFWVKSDLGLWMAKTWGSV